MAGQIDKCKYFWTFVANISPIQWWTMRWGIYNLELLVNSRTAGIQFWGTCPFESKPRISFPTDDVLPVSISCLWRNNFCLAWPRPLSKQLCVSTPNNVDFPASTLPTTAILTSQKSASASNRLRSKKSLVSFPSSISFVRKRVSEQSNFEATFSKEATTLSQSSAGNPKMEIRENSRGDLKTDHHHLRPQNQLQLESLFPLYRTIPFSYD